MALRASPAQVVELPSCCLVAVPERVAVEHEAGSKSSRGAGIARISSSAAVHCTAVVGMALSTVVVVVIVTVAGKALETLADTTTVLNREAEEEDVCCLLLSRCSSSS